MGLRNKSSALSVLFLRIFVIFQIRLLCVVVSPLGAANLNVMGASALVILPTRGISRSSRAFFKSIVAGTYRQAPFSNPTGFWLSGRTRLFHSSTSALDDNKSSKNNSTSSGPYPSAFGPSSWDESEFAIHVAIPEADAPMAANEAVDRALQQKRQPQQENYTADELVRLGSVWFLPAQDMGNPYRKPTRLINASQVLEAGDYLRIHHTPRRFPAVHEYNWTLPESSDYDSNNNPSTDKPSVIVAATDTYIVLNKPPGSIPVHPTVDNHAENVVACLRQANPERLSYVTLPHRLDHDTSGLLTLATTKAFATYFSSLLKVKTAQQLVTNSTTTENDDNNNHKALPTGTAIRKRYRCLVCLVKPSPTSDIHSNNMESGSWSVQQALQELRSYVNDDNNGGDHHKEHKVMRHYLEPSIRAPKRFVRTIPAEQDLQVPGSTDDNSNEKKARGEWLESLMIIQNVGDVFALIGNQAGRDLAHALWPDSKSQQIPTNCQAVVELEIELLTGRTHQIRGQLAAEGFPLVGDAPYGGAQAMNLAKNASVLARMADGTSNKLALQCCQLEFLDPDVPDNATESGGMKLVPSTRWNSFRLEEAWWTPFLQRYEQQMAQTSAEDMTTMASDVGLVGRGPLTNKDDDAAASAVASDEEVVDINPAGLPPQVMLSPGVHKYVIVKAIHPNSQSTKDVFRWFVKSASPSECGGPYHKDVAKDLTEWIEACGFKAIVTGGGRIYYQDDTKPKPRALVYGFSYGFGQGDHALAASVIRAESNRTIDAAYDDNPDLY